MNRLFTRTAVFIVVAVLIAAGLGYWQYREARNNVFKTGTPLTASDAVSGEIPLLGADFSVDPLSKGWGHRTFLRYPPTDYSMTTIDGRRALHCATHASASILARHTAIPVADFRTLSWEWKIETPLTSNLDEATREGDDHPARFFVSFKSTEDTAHRAEIIWSNKRFQPGDYKDIEGFLHLVVNGHDENVGVWHAQSVDLMALYRKISGRTDNPVMDVLGFFCDSDNTGGQTSAYFADVVLKNK